MGKHAHPVPPPWVAFFFEGPFFFTVGEPLETPHISFENVEVKYSEIVYGLRSASLRIARGEFVFLTGPSGAGKSTMLKLVTKEVRPTNGRIVLDGREIGEIAQRFVPGIRRQMGIVPQDFALLPRKRVYENVAYAMRAVGHSKRDVRKRVPEILQQVHIAHRADAFPHELSGGEQQRVAIGRALVNDPPLLLADEPTGNLDPEHSWEIMELLKELNRNGTTIVVASHDMMVVSRMAERIVSLLEGRVVADQPATVAWQDTLPLDLPEDGLDDLLAAIPDRGAPFAVVEAPIPEQEGVHVE